MKREIKDIAPENKVKNNAKEITRKEAIRKVVKLFKDADDICEIVTGQRLHQVGKRLIDAYGEDIGKKIVSVCDRKDIDYSFKVIEDEQVNAFSLPGGFVYVNKGLVDKVANDDELACDW